jgi:hypothetical protein
LEGCEDIVAFSNFGGICSNALTAKNQEPRTLCLPIFPQDVLDQLNNLNINSQLTSAAKWSDQPSCKPAFTSKSKPNLASSCQKHNSNLFSDVVPIQQNQNILDSALTDLDMPGSQGCVSVDKSASKYSNFSNADLLIQNILA